LFTALLSCGSNDPVDDPIPFQAFPDVEFNISQPEFSALQIDGGYVAKSYSEVQAGIQGIIIYRENSTTFRTFEQNCSFQPNEPSSVVEAFATHMQCSGCASHFNFEGNPSGGGPAWRPLGQYKTSISGSTVTITDEVINY
jgi:hypothetical protein